MYLNQLITAPIYPNDLHLDQDIVVRMLGYEKAMPDDSILETIDDSLKECKELLHPKGGFCFVQAVQFNTQNGTMELKTTALHPGKTILSQLRNTSLVALFVGTIGKELEQRSKTLLAEGDLLKGYCMDLIGSLFAEKVAERIHHNIRETAKKEGLSITNRFSPGYCEWSVAEQFKLFNLVDGATLGVTLNASALMSPIKSVSGIVGVGQHVRFKEYQCKKCTNDKCVYRNQRKYEETR